MEILAGLAVVVLVLAVLATPFVAFAALRRTAKLTEELQSLRTEVTWLRGMFRQLRSEAAGEAPSRAPQQEREPGPRHEREQERAADATPATAAVHPVTGPVRSLVSRFERAAEEESTPPEAEISADEAPEIAGPDVAEPDVTEPRTLADEEAELPSGVGASAGAPGSPPFRDSAPSGGRSWKERPAEASAAREALDFETLIGSTWLLRIGLGVIAIAFALFARSVVPSLPAAAKVALAYVTALALFAVGKVFEERLEKFARPVMAGGLAFGFFVAFAAYFVPAMRAVSMPISLAWMTLSMVSVLVVAERWKSEYTAGLAIVLGHVSALVAAGDADVFSLVLIVFLAATAVALLLRHSWVVLGVVTVFLSYGSHLLWILSDRQPISGDAGFWLNVVFLSAYYAVFLIADVLWWRRDMDRGEDEITGLQANSARQLGPANLVFYVTLTSFAFVVSGARVESIEWYFLTIGVLQGALAWFYRGVHHRDFVFYPAFGTILWTMGLIAWLDALALNLVLASQALLLLLTAHRTRLWIFHGLAQAAMAVAFIHYLVYPAPQTRTSGVLLGGLAVAVVYFLKSALEEVWYGDRSAADWFSEESSFAGRGLGTVFARVFAPIAPHLSALHAAVGGFVVAREIFAQFGEGMTTVLCLLAAQAALLAIVLFRRREALLFGVGVIAAAAPLQAVSDPGSLATLIFLDGLVVLAFVLSLATESRLPGSRALRALGHGQVLVGFALLGGLLASLGSDIVLGGYLLALTLPLLVLTAQEHMRTVQAQVPPLEEGEPEPGIGWLPVLACLVAAGFALVLTDQSIGITVTTPVWIGGWATAVLLAAAGRRSTLLFVTGYALLFVGYAYFLGSDPGVGVATLRLWWVGLTVTAVPLVLAVAMDRTLDLRESGDEDTRAAAGPATLLAYAVALLLLGGLAHFQIPPGWSLVALSVVAATWTFQAKPLRTPLAVPAVIVGLLMLHAVLLSAVTGGEDIVMLLLPLTLFAVLTLVAERGLARWLAGEESGGAWRIVHLALVAIATLTTLVAVYGSSLFGPTWATAGWSLLAASLMGAGFGLRVADYRRVALVVLGACLVRVFFVDTVGLSDTARTGAFFVLGLCLLAAAWLYTRYSEELKSWL